MNKLPARCIMILTAGLLLAQPVIAAEEQSGRVARERTKNAAGKGLRVGDMAPDFELPRLDSFLKRTDSGDTRPRTVRLSSFRNKRLVVLIFSSYT